MSEIAAYDSHWFSLDFNNLFGEDPLIYYKRQKDFLEYLGDTHRGCKWQKFLYIVEDLGFKPGFHETFIGTEGIEEQEFIFYHEEKGLILHATSYNGEDLATGNIYGEVKTSSEHLTQKEIDALSYGASYCYTDDGVINFSLNADNGLRLQLASISQVFKFSKTWSKVPRLWFLTYMDTRDNKFDYKGINNRKIAASAPEVRKIIFG